MNKTERRGCLSHANKFRGAMGIDPNDGGQDDNAPSVIVSFSIKA